MGAAPSRNNYWVIDAFLHVMPDDTVRVSIIPNDIAVHSQLARQFRDRDLQNLQPKCQGSFGEPEDPRIHRDVYVHMHCDEEKEHMGDGLKIKEWVRKADGFRDAKVPESTYKIKTSIVVPKTLEQVFAERDEFIPPTQNHFVGWAIPEERWYVSCAVL
jgi:hypothetical protein